MNGNVECFAIVNKKNKTAVALTIVEQLFSSLCCVFCSLLSQCSLYNATIVSYFPLHERRNRTFLFFLPSLRCSMWTKEYVLLTSQNCTAATIKCIAFVYSKRFVLCEHIPLTSTKSVDLQGGSTERLLQSESWASEWATNTSGTTNKRIRNKYANQTNKQLNLSE